jgi:hypothetical protein
MSLRPVCSGCFFERKNKSYLLLASIWYTAPQAREQIGGELEGNNGKVGESTVALVPTKMGTSGSISEFLRI